MLSSPLILLSSNDVQLTVLTFVELDSNNFFNFQLRWASMRSISYLALEEFSTSSDARFNIAQLISKKQGFLRSIGSMGLFPSLSHKSLKQCISSHSGVKMRHLCFSLRRNASQRGTVVQCWDMKGPNGPLMRQIYLLSKLGMIGIVFWIVAMNSNSRTYKPRFISIEYNRLNCLQLVKCYISYIICYYYCQIGSTEMIEYIISEMDCNQQINSVFLNGIKTPRYAVSIRQSLADNEDGTKCNGQCHEKQLLTSQKQMLIKANQQLTQQCQHYNTLIHYLNKQLTNSLNTSITYPTNPQPHQHPIISPNQHNQLLAQLSTLRHERQFQQLKMKSLEAQLIYIKGLTQANAQLESIMEVDEKDSSKDKLDNTNYRDITLKIYQSSIFNSNHQWGNKEVEQHLKQMLINKKIIQLQTQNKQQQSTIQTNKEQINSLINQNKSIYNQCLNLKGKLSSYQFLIDLQNKQLTKFISQYDQQIAKFIQFKTQELQKKYSSYKTQYNDIKKSMKKIYQQTKTNQASLNVSIASKYNYSTIAQNDFAITQQLSIKCQNEFQYANILNQSKQQFDILSNQHTKLIKKYQKLEKQYQSIIKIINEANHQQPIPDKSSNKFIPKQQKNTNLTNQTHSTNHSGYQLPKTNFHRCTTPIQIKSPSIKHPNYNLNINYHHLPPNYQRFSLQQSTTPMIKIPIHKKQCSINNQLLVNKFDARNHSKSFK